MTYMVVFLRHLESVLRGRILSSRESGLSVTGAKAYSSRNCRPICAAGRLAPASGPLSAVRPETVPATSHRGSQGGFHRQIAQGAGPKSSARRSPREMFDQRLGGPRVGGPTASPLTPWVEPGDSANWSWPPNHARIAWGHKKWRKPMRCWCRRTTR